jgi:hypothetical protein
MATRKSLRIREPFEDLKDVTDDPATLDASDDPDFMDMIQVIVDDSLVSKPIKDDSGASTSASVNICNDDAELNAFINELVDFSSTESTVASQETKAQEHMNETCIAFELNGVPAIGYHNSEGVVTSYTLMNQVKSVAVMLAYFNGSSLHDVMPSDVSLQGCANITPVASSRKQ